MLEGWDQVSLKRTVRRIHVSDIGVVGGFARPQADSRRAAQRVRAVVAIECSPVVSEMLFEKWHIGKRVHV